MKFIRLVILIILSLAAVESHTGLKFKQIKVQDGLSQSWVKCIYQDSYGYLWFGTAEGVNKYNGCDFRLYKNDPGDNKTLSNNLVNVIFEDSSGNLWVGTQSGINIYDRVKDHFNRYPELQEEYINDFIELNDGRIIVAYNAGMSVLYPSGDSVNTADGLDSLVNRFPMVSASDLLQDKKGNIWIASYYGVYLLDLSNRKLTLFELDKK
ncbi:MAG: two-component regulator propeller domain-containing protein, partial [Calditrichaceae bacterium]